MELMRSLFTFIFCCIILSRAGAQVSVNSLEQLLDYADKNSFIARQASLQVAAARQDIHIQSSGLYPKVNVFGTGDYYPIIATQVIPAEVLGGKPGTYLKAQFGLPYIFTAGTEVSMPVINMEKWTQVSKAKAMYRQAEWNRRLAVENLHLQLIQAYYQLLVTREVVRLNNENAATIDELMRIMDDRKSAGVLNPADYNRSANLQKDINVTNENYNRLLGQYGNDLFALIGTEANISDSIGRFAWASPVMDGEVTQRPAYHESEAKVQSMSLQLAESKRAALPKLNLNGRYAYNLQSKFEQGSNDVTFDVANVGLRLDIPLFQGNYYRSVQQKNSLQLQIAKVDKERVEAQLTQQLKDWIAQYVAAFNKHGQLEAKLAAAADNLRIAKLSMQEGIMEFDEFNNIFTEYNRTRLEYIQNQADGVLYYLLSTQKF